MRTRYSRRRTRAERTGPRRHIPVLSSQPPAVAYKTYSEAVDLRAVGFFQVDPRTWIAERHEGQTGEREWGVDAWTVIQSHVAITGDVTYACSPCPDFAKYGSCVHVMVLEDADRPPFQPFSERGAQLGLSSNNEQVN